jgi:hypothetical protein
MRWVIDSSDAASIVKTRREVAEHVRDETHGRSDDFMVELITGEILAAEWYRHGGAIAVEVSWEHGNAVLELWDQGPEIELGEVPDPLNPPGNLVLRQFARELHVEHTDQGNHIRVALPAHKASGVSASRRIWEMAATLVGLRSQRIAERFHSVIRDDEAAP